MCISIFQFCFPLASLMLMLDYFTRTDSLNLVPKIGLVRRMLRALVSVPERNDVPLVTRDVCESGIGDSVIRVNWLF